MTELTGKVVEFAKKVGKADLVGIAPVSRFDKDDPIYKIFPETKSVIGLGFRILRGSLRGIEEGTTYYQYSTMAVECLEETVMPCSVLRVSTFLEDNGFIAVPQRREQHIMAEKDEINPEILNDYIWRNRPGEIQMNFEDAAVKCGLGELGFHGSVLCDEFGPLFRYVFILTDAELDPSDVYVPHLCDKCKKCVKACHGKAIDEENGKKDSWNCAVYYAGANGTKNPFMNTDAFADIEDRLSVIAGDAKITKEKAKAILKEIHFYPPVGHEHAYQSSVCGKACDTACYIHLEEKGVLTKKFKENFRKRPEWKFDIKDFEMNK